MLMFTMVGLGWTGRVWLDTYRYLGRVMSPLAWSLWSQGQGATLLVESGLTFAMLISSRSTYIRFVMDTKMLGSRVFRLCI